MARGLPDYANPDYGVVSTLIDNGDLLTSSVGFARLDGGGRIISFDDFRAGWHRYDDQSFSGGAVAAMDFSENHLHGFSGSVRMDPVANNGVSTMIKTSYIPFSGKIGLEVGFFPALNAGRYTFRLAFDADTSGSYQAGVYVEEDTGDVYLEIPSGAVRVYDSAIAHEWANTHVALKVVFDPFTRKYDSLIVAGVRKDISTHSLKTFSPTAVGRVTETQQVLGVGATYVEPVYLEYVITTADEP